MAIVITLTGPAHCGKSTVRNMLMGYKNESFKPVLFKKYTTRVSRANDDDVICVQAIPSECDLVYEQYGVRYGLQFSKLYGLLQKGKTPIVVLNDIRAVEDVRNALGPQVISLFLYRKPAALQDFLREEASRAKPHVTNAQIKQSAETRYEKATAIYRIYIENIHLFDNVVLNVSNLENTREQILHIVKKISTQAEGLK